MVQKIIIYLLKHSDWVVWVPVNCLWSLVSTYQNLFSEWSYFSKLNAYEQVFG